ncbi:hypothetical protein ACE7GA_18645 [Roseomonas sp. CCTCC AB2023176]|uniref:hypothetical protein n=1 Tax=Roseomonas sp. CCTCC AB2023176 TaxID=3342640 RepID=UPI0035E03DF1
MPDGSEPMDGAARAARERRIGLACAFALLLVWAGFILFSRLSAKQALTPWDTAALRYAGAFLFILPLIAARGSRGSGSGEASRWSGRRGSAFLSSPIAALPSRRRRMVP